MDSTKTLSNKWKNYSVKINSAALTDVVNDWMLEWCRQIAMSQSCQHWCPGKRRCRIHQLHPCAEVGRGFDSFPVKITNEIPKL